MVKYNNVLNVVITTLCNVTINWVATVLYCHGLTIGSGVMTLRFEQLKQHRYTTRQTSSWIANHGHSDASP